MVDAVVLGAGVIGLSVARELADRGLKVAVVARDLPEDADSVGFASPWAGCNWFSFEADGRCQAADWDRRTFLRLQQLAKEQPHLCERLPFHAVWERPRDFTEPWYTELVGGVEYTHAAAKDYHGKEYGYSFSSYVIHAPAYTAWLGEQVRARGVPIIRRRLSALDEAYNVPGVGPVELVVNCLGLGSKALIGVEDDKMYPARGQTVLVRAPDVRQCIMHTEGFNAVAKPGDSPLPDPAYIIPRPGPEGHVVLGGCYIRNDYSSLPSLPEAERILRACYDLEPGLANGGSSWRDIEVVAHNVGLRPAREGGARLELDRREVGDGAAGGTHGVMAPRAGTAGPKRAVGVVHCYGSGGAGYQSSMGMAEDAADLVLQYLLERKAKLA